MVSTKEYLSTERDDFDDLPSCFSFQFCMLAKRALEPLPDALDDGTTTWAGATGVPCCEYTLGACTGIPNNAAR